MGRSVEQDGGLREFVHRPKLYSALCREVLMLRKLPFSVLALLLASTGCARHTIAPVVLTPQTRIGPAEDFGPGIRDVTPSDVDVILDAPAYIIALRVTRELGIQVVAPQAGSPRSKRGAHYFRGGAPSTSDPPPRSVSSKACTVGADAREACMGLSMRWRIAQLKLGGATSDAPGYWLLIVSDTPTPAQDVMRRLGSMNLADTSLVALVRSIPEPFIASRTTRWAAYYAPFGTDNP
jgi:hypothetical protein